MAMTNKEDLEKIYLKIIEWGTYLALSTPLIFIKGYFFPFVVPKTIFFRIIVDVIFVAYILLALSNPRYRPRITPLTITIAVFLAILVLTSLGGINFARSFWSVFERMTGLLTFFHLFAFYLVLTGVFKERKEWERILSVSILVAILAALYALFSANPITRGGGAIGNSSFLSAYILFNLFFSLILLIVKPGTWRIFYGLALIVFLCSLFFNPGGFTRGAVFAFAVGMVLFGLGWMFFSKNKLLKKLTPAVLIFAILIGILIIKNFHFQDRPFDIRNIPDRSRQLVWSMGWQAWQEKFWLGWGLENFNAPFAKYYDPKLPLTGDIWYDRVHNIVLDTGVSSGIIGLLSYLSTFGLSIFCLLKLLPKIAERKEIVIPLGMIALLVTYFFQNLWVFDMVSSYTMFFLSLAFINFLISLQKKEITDQKVVPLPSLLGISLIILAILAFFLGNIQPVRAAGFILKGIASPLEWSLPSFQNAFKMSPLVKFEGPEQFSMKITTLAEQPGQNRELLSQGFQLAEQEFKKSILKNPLDFRLYLFLGRHYNAFYNFSQEEEKLNLAEEVLEKALKLSPNNQQVYFIFAQTRFLQGKQEEALEFLRKAKELEPRFAGSRWYLLRGYKMTGRYELALSELKELEELGFDWQQKTETLKEGIEILKETGQDIKLLIPLYEKGVEFNPQDLYLWEDLVNAYINTGQIKEAKAAVEEFREIRPEFTPQVEQLLKELEAVFPNETPD